MIVQQFHETAQYWHQYLICDADENIYLCSEYVSFCKNSVNYDHKNFMKNLNNHKNHFVLATQEEGKLKELFETLK